MAKQKLLKTTKVSSKCAVKIYRDSEYDVFVVKSLIIGSKRNSYASAGSYETNDKQDARNTAARQARWLKKQSSCR